MRADPTAGAGVRVSVALVALVLALALSGCAQEERDGDGGGAEGAVLPTPSVEPDTSVPGPPTTAAPVPTTTIAPVPTPSAPVAPVASGTPGPEASAAGAAEEAARAFAAEVVGLDDPVARVLGSLGPETAHVDVRGNTGEGGRSGRPTIVLLERRDQDWTVVGTVADNILVDAPARGQAVSSPLTLRGRADAFEGTVTVAVKADRDGGYQELGAGFVTGAMGALGQFEGTVAFSASPTPTGWVVFTEPTAASDGGPISATTVPVVFE